MKWLHSLNIKLRSEESLWWLVGINLTSRVLNLASHKIIHFTSRGENSQNIEQNNGFKIIIYLYDPPKIQDLKINKV